VIVNSGPEAGDPLQRRQGDWKRQMHGSTHRQTRPADRLAEAVGEALDVGKHNHSSFEHAELRESIDLTLKRSPS
jgi:hypothetical protein